MSTRISQQNPLATWAQQQGLGDLGGLRKSQLKKAARALDLSLGEVQSLRDQAVAQASQAVEAGRGASQQIGGGQAIPATAGQRDVSQSPAMVFHGGGGASQAFEPALSDIGIQFIEGREGYTEFRDASGARGHTIYPSVEPEALDVALQTIGAEVSGPPEKYKYDFVRTSTLDTRTFDGADDAAEAAAEKLYIGLGGDLDEARMDDTALIVPRKDDPRVKAWLFRYTGGMGEDAPYVMPIVVSYDGSRATAAVKGYEAGPAVAAPVAQGGTPTLDPETPVVEDTAAQATSYVAQTPTFEGQVPETLADLGIEWVENPRRGYKEFRDPFGGRGHTVYSGAEAAPLDAALKQVGAPVGGEPEDYKYNLVRISTLDTRTFGGASDAAEAAAEALFAQMGGDLEEVNRDDTVLLATRDGDHVVGWLFGFLGGVDGDVRQVNIAVSYDGQKAQALEE